MLRADMRNCLLFDNGDFLQGNPLADLIARAGELPPGQIHPMIAAMNAVGYDAATIGNHEFDYGLPFLKEALAGATFPVVSANIFVQEAAAERSYLPPFVLLDRMITLNSGELAPIRIGVIGFAPPQLVDWNKMVLKDQIRAEGIVQSAERLVPQMLAAGADLIVALSHSGICDEPACDEMENASVPLAAVPGISAVLAGHTHQLFPGPDLQPSAIVDPLRGTLHGKPAVMAGQFGSHIGVIDLLLDYRDGKWTVADHHARVEPVAPRSDAEHILPRFPVAPDIQAGAQAAHAAILAHIRKPIGETTVPLHSYFARIAPDRSLQVVADAQRAHAAWILADTEYAGLPLLSAVAPGKSGGLAGPANYVDIAPGMLAMRHAAELYVFPNSFCIILLQGAGLLDWLERSACQFLQVTPGRSDQPLINPNFPSYNFDILDGLTYAIDPSQPSRYDDVGRLLDPAATRISSLCWQGHPVLPDQPFVVATNSYRVGGGGGFASVTGARILHHANENCRDILIQHLQTAGPLELPERPVWRFARLAETAAWFDSGAGGLRHLPDISATTVTDAGPGIGGFRRFRMGF